MATRIMFGTTVKVKFSQLHPSSSARKLSSLVDVDGFIKDLTFKDYREYSLHGQEVQCALLQHGSDPNLTLLTQEINMCIPETPLLTTLGPPEPRPNPPTAATTILMPSDSAQLIVPVQQPPRPQSPQPLLASDVESTRISAILATVAKGKSKLAVGDKVACLIRRMHPVRDVKVWAGSQHERGVLKDAIIADIVQYKHKKRGEIPSVKINIDNNTFFVPIRNVIISKTGRQATTTQSSGTAERESDDDASEVNDAAEGEADDSSDEAPANQEADAPEEDTINSASPTSTTASQSTSSISWGVFGDIRVDIAKADLATNSAFFRRIKSCQREAREPFTPLEVFDLCFPLDYLETHVLPATNNAGKALSPNTWRDLSIQELHCFIGLQLLFTCHKHGEKEAFFSPKPPQLWEPHLRITPDIMTIHRYREISRAFRISDDFDKKDKFGAIRDLIACWNEHMRAEYCPSWLNCLDESMVQWENEATCPGSMYIERKPTPRGNEYHTIADAETKILFCVELVEGKDQFATPDYIDKGKTVGLLLRMTEQAGLWASGKAVVLDSAFAVLAGLLELAKKGVFAMACIKKKRYWPRCIDGELMKTKLESAAIGLVVSRRAEYVDPTNSDSGSVPFFHVAFKDANHVGQLMSTFGSTVLCGPTKYRRTEAGLVEFRYASAFHTYYAARNAVDVNNQHRQGIHPVEQLVGTTFWSLRHFWFLVGVSETNAFLAFRQFVQPPAHTASEPKITFRGQLAAALITSYIQFVQQDATSTPNTRSRKANEVPCCDHIANPSKRKATRGDGQEYNESRRLKCHACYDDPDPSTADYRTNRVCACDIRVPMCSYHYSKHLIK